MSVVMPVYSSITAALLLFLQLLLMLVVIRSRWRFKQGIGDGGHAVLAQKIRSHANLAENAALFLIVLVLLEMIGAHPLAVLGLGLGFVFVRVCHAVGLSASSGTTLARFIGAAGTLLIGLVCAGYLFVVAVAALR